LCRKTTQDSDYDRSSILSSTISDSGNNPSSGSYSTRPSLSPKKSSVESTSSLESVSSGGSSLKKSPVKFAPRPPGVEAAMAPTSQPTQAPRAIVPNPVAPAVVKRTPAPSNQPVIEESTPSNAPKQKMASKTSMENLNQASKARVDQQPGFQTAENQTSPNKPRINQQPVVSQTTSIPAQGLAPAPRPRTASQLPPADKINQQPISQTNSIPVQGLAPAPRPRTASQLPPADTINQQPVPQTTSIPAREVVQGQAAPAPRSRMPSQVPPTDNVTAPIDKEKAVATARPQTARAIVPEAAKVVAPRPQTATGGAAFKSKFCGECGFKFQTLGEKFCCDCGTKRI
jgi:hypothetical protein